MNTPAQSPETAAEGAPSYGMPIDLNRLGAALWRMRLWLVLVFIVGAGAGIFLAKIAMPLSYKALAVLRYDGMTKLPGIPEPDETALAELEAAFGKTTVLEDAKEKVGFKLPTKVFKKRVSTSSSTQTQTVAITYEADTPKQALEGAEALVARAEQYRIDRRRSNIQDALDRSEARVEKLRGDVDELRKRYKEFRKEHGIADLSAERQEGLRGAASLQARRDLTEAEVKALEAQVQQLETQVRRAPTMEVASSNVSNPDAERLADLESQLAEARSSLSDQHPKVRSLELQVSNLRKRVSSGGGSQVSHSTMQRSSTLSSAKADLITMRGRLLAAKEQFSSLSTLAAEAQEKVKHYGEIEGQAVAIMSQLQVAENLLAEARETNAKLTAAMQAPESGFTVIEPPSEPETPEKNAARKKLALLIPLALMFLVALQGLLKEFWGARIVTSAELGFWGKGPVLAASTWPRDETAFDELVADFDDCAPLARGETLMVAASESVMEAAGELARRLHAEWFENAVLVETKASSQLPRTRALASGDEPRRSMGATIELWRSPPENESADSNVHGGAGAGRGASAPPPALGRVVAWNGGMDGHGLRRAARLADRIVVLVEAGSLNPFALRAVRAAIARDDGVGFILVSAPETVSQGRDRVGPVREFWGAQPA